jgi:hypothetical protein
MNIYEDTNPRELKDLLRQIHKGEAVLPDFQRDFVWDPYMTMELIISIAENYPAGSLLRIRNTQNLFAFREFAGAPQLNGEKPTYLVLDGQQRLTSLYQAFYGVGENKFFLNLKQLMNGKDFEDCIFYLRTNDKKATYYETLETQAKDLVMPLEVLKGGAGEYNKWVRDITRGLVDEKERIALEDQLYSVDTWVQVVDDYKFPVVTLSDSTSAEAVCTIFETLNRTGVKLSPFELLTARFWHQKLNLRERWANAIEKHPIIKLFGVDPYYVLQIVSLISKEKPAIRRSEVMNLEKDTVEEYWDDAIEGLKQALTFLQGQCGVVIASLLPYNTIIIPLAGMFSRIQNFKGPKIGAAKDKFEKWYWCAVFGQKYESAPNSQAAVDFQEVIKWIEEDKEPQTIGTFLFDPSALLNITPRQRAIYRGVLSLVMKNHARDFHSHDILTAEIIRQHEVDDHHIFPNKYLERNGVESRARDCVLNHTFIDRKTNIRISDRAPSEYMEEILDERGVEKFNELLDSHFLPMQEDHFFITNDYSGFLLWRQDKIWKEIQKVTTKGNNALVTVPTQEVNLTEIVVVEEEEEEEEEDYSDPAAQSTPSRDTSHYDITAFGVTIANQPKRRCMLHVIKSLCEHGAKAEKIAELIFWRSGSIFFKIEGTCSSEEFIKGATEQQEAIGKNFDPGRWFCDEDHLIFQDENTYAFSRMWGVRWRQALNILNEYYPDVKIVVSKSQDTDLIDEYHPNQQSVLHELLVDLVQQEPGLILDHSPKSHVRFWINDLDTPILKQGQGWTNTGRILLFQFNNFDDRLWFYLVLGPGPVEIRQKIHDMAHAHKPTFKPMYRTLNKKWNVIYEQRIISPSTYSGTTVEEKEIEIRKKWKQFLENDLPQIQSILKSQDWIWKQ